MEKQKCDECKCSRCFYKSDCCPECEGAILDCEEYSETDIYGPSEGTWNADQAAIICESSPCENFPYSKVRKYRDMEQRLKKVYGDCDGLLEKVVEHLVTHEDITLPEPIFKARILTDGEVDRWEAYKAIGTVEECREAMEKRMAVTPTITATFYTCPECGAIRSIRQKHSYCHDCGQALDWK